MTRAVRNIESDAMRNIKHQHTRKQRAYEDLSGQTFGRLTVISRAETPATPVSWNCLCSCGTHRVVTATRLRTGNTRSCGCLKIDAIRAARTTHGHTVGGRVTPEFWAWVNARARCNNPKHPLFKWYGARGIRVAPDWDCPGTGFQAFLASVGVMPAPGLSLDRIDNARGYEPGNCRWASDHTQNRNRRGNKWIEGIGQRLILSDWARLFGVSTDIFKRRLQEWNDDMLPVVMLLKPSLLGMYSSRAVYETHTQQQPQAEGTAASLRRAV